MIRKGSSCFQCGQLRMIRVILLLYFLMPIPLVVSAQDPVSDFQRLLEQGEKARKSEQFEEARMLLDSARTNAVARNDRADLCRVRIEQAFIEQMQGQYNKALGMLYEVERVRKELDDRPGLAEVYNNIGALQQNQKDYDKAEEWYGRSLAIYEELGMDWEVAKCLNNFGALNEDRNEPEKAIAYHKQSMEMWRSLGQDGWMGVSYMHIGVCLDQLGIADSARYYLERSLEICEARNARYMVSLISIALGNNIRESGGHLEAIRRCNIGLEIAESTGIVPFQQRACECLYRTYEAMGKEAQAFRYYKQYVMLRDSVFGQENIKELTRIEMSNIFAQRQLADSLQQAREKMEADLRYQADVTRERETRNIAFFSVVLVLGLAVGLWSRLRYMRRSRSVIQHERDRSDELLLNILPEEVAQELKDKGSAEAQDIEEVTILFTDFKGFTAISEKLTAQELVAEIDTCFKAFDNILTEHDIEKIKTIGDAYMAAGGLPVAREGAVADTVRAALEMQQFMKARQAERKALGLPAFSMRAGIHTGPVVAGIVGVKKFAYDVWGDTVNIASRMESSGEVGEVNISRTTYALIHEEPDLVFVPRGKVQAKGKGEMEMYFVRPARVLAAL